MATPNRPRRRAKQRRALETVDVILEASARVLAARGYASATTNRIAREAGVSVGTVYEYFANKAEVYERLIDRELERIVGAISSEPLPSQAPIDAKLGQVVRAAMAAMRHGPGLYRSLEQVPNATFRTKLAEARAAIVGFVRNLLAEHRAELRVGDLDLAAFVVVASAEGVGATVSEEAFDERLAAELTDFVRAYLVGTA